MIRCLFMIFILGYSLAYSHAQEIFGSGSTAITGFSGTVVNKDHDEYSHPTNETVFDTQGVVLNVNNLSAIGGLMDASELSQITPFFQVKAVDIGQVSSLAFDDLKPHNLYVGATSLFGLNLMVPDQDNDTYAERVRIGQPNARWMPGQFGSLPKAGPGTVYRIDGKTGEITVFSNLQLENRTNSGAGIGDLAWDKLRDQLYATDLDSGMIYRFDKEGALIETFDHGVKGRANVGMSAVPEDITNVIDITSSTFNTDDIQTWGLADPNRRVWGIGISGGRLYYSVAGSGKGAEIWSLGFDKQTDELVDAQLEFIVDKGNAQAPILEISDMVIAPDGHLILAERARRLAKYDYSAFSQDDEARVLHYFLENPDDPKTPSRWVLNPEESAVGFDGNNNKGSGGIDLGYGYDMRGNANTKTCGETLWSTGEALRVDVNNQAWLERTGRVFLAGIQGMPARAYKPVNTPPVASIYVDFSIIDEPDSSAPEIIRYMGHVSDVETLCGGSGKAQGENGEGDGYGYGNFDDYWQSSWWTYPDEDCATSDSCGPSDCWVTGTCPAPKPACMAIETKITCDNENGQYSVDVDIQGEGDFAPDSLKVTTNAFGVRITPSPMVSLKSAKLGLVNAQPNQPISLFLCAFNKSSDPSATVDCCRAETVLPMPSQACKAQ